MFTARIQNRTTGSFGTAALLTILVAVVAYGQEATFDDLDRLGRQALRSTRQYEEAETLFARALTTLQTSTTADKGDMAEILTNQGRLFIETGRYALFRIHAKTGGAAHRAR